MTQSNSRSTTKETGKSEVPRPVPGTKPGERLGGSMAATISGGQLATSGGRTQIAEAVVAKIAGMAAREVGGVYTMGAGMARTFGSMRERLPGGGVNVTQGVAVEVGERQSAVDIDLVVEYGVSIPDLSNAVRRNVMTAIERMCGLEVVEVNISVDDVHLPNEEESPESPAAEPRVQ